MDKNIYRYTIYILYGYYLTLFIWEFYPYFLQRCYIYNTIQNKHHNQKNTFNHIVMNSIQYWIHFNLLYYIVNVISTKLTIKFIYIFPIGWNIKISTEFPSFKTYILNLLIFHLKIEFTSFKTCILNLLIFHLKILGFWKFVSTDNTFDSVTYHVESNPKYIQVWSSPTHAQECLCKGLWSMEDKADFYLWITMSWTSCDIQKEDEHSAGVFTNSITRITSWWWIRFTNIEQHYQIRTTL